MKATSMLKRQPWKNIVSISEDNYNMLLKDTDDWKMKKKSLLDIL